jgi:hypothetical protein
MDGETQSKWTSLDRESAAGWLRDPAPMEDEPFGWDQDFDIIFPGTLEGGIAGHLRFYRDEPVPNPEKKQFLLNSIYILSWYVLPGHFRGRGFLGFLKPPNPDNLKSELKEAIDIADASNIPELARWASDVRTSAIQKRKPKYSFWCDAGWLKPR